MAGWYRYNRGNERHIYEIECNIEGICYIALACFFLVMVLSPLLDVLFRSATDNVFFLLNTMQVWGIYI